MTQPSVTIEGLSAVPVETCNLGHSTPPHKLWQKAEFTYYRCPDCGLAWVTPQLTDDAVAQIEGGGFDGRLEVHPHPSSFLPYRHRLRALEPYRQQGRLLDVGSFTGNFLLAAREAGWAEVEGTETCIPAVEHARSVYGLTVHEGDLTELDLPADHYDAITLLDVIEHVSDPLDAMRRMHRLLRPGGVLYMETPHFYSIPYLLLGQSWSVFFPWHRFYFSVPNMRQALEMAGYRVAQASAVGVLPFSRYDPWALYKTQVSVPPEPTLAQTGLARRYKDLLRPAWLGVKRAHEAPFRLLSQMGVHIGAKLVVRAEKI